MAENFYTILTATGKAKLANSAVLGSKVNFKTLKVGDGKGSYYEPTENQTALLNEVWSGNIGSISVDENNPNWIVTETLIPATIGGFFIREAGIFDEDGDLIAISKLSETYKPVVSEGSIKDLCIKIILEVSNVESVTLKIDPTVIVATRKDIQNLEAEIQATNTNVSKLYQQQKTYGELKTLVANNQLVPGTQYILTDYKTKYLQPHTLTLKELSVERLVLTASSTNTFETICSSLDFPQDIIYYRFDLNLCEDGITSRPGFITRRVDETPGVNINAPLDWRKILWARYKPNPTQYLIGTTLTSYSVWTSGPTQLGVIYKVGNTLYTALRVDTPTSNTDSNIFEPIYEDITVGLLIEDLKVGSTGTQDIKLQKSTSYTEHLTFGANCYNIEIAETRHGQYNSLYCFPNNIFRNNCYNITFGTGCINNTIDHNCANITFASNCCNNILGNTCNNNDFGSNCYDNVFAPRCMNNTFGASCYNNIFGPYCQANHFLSLCWNNTFSNLCAANTFQSGCSYNIFASTCSANNLGGNCYQNIFGYGCSSNIFGESCFKNTFGVNCSFNSLDAYSPGNVFGDLSMYNHLGTNCHHNNFGTNCVGNNLGLTSQYVTFGNNKRWLNIKLMTSKNISGITDLESRTYNTNIELRSDGVAVYWSINNSNTPVYTVIA